MRISDLYRGLLSLYPADFRKQFSAEMLSVFEQRALECSRNRRSASIGLVLAEFSSIMKGACTMWFEKIPLINRHSPRSNAVASTDVPLTVPELMNQRETAINNIVASIATHDFINARRYSYEENRLKSLLQSLQSEQSMEHGKIV